MRKLHLVGVTPDLQGLLFTARRGAKSGGYVVALDDEVLDAIADAHRRSTGDASGSDPRLAGAYPPPTMPIPAANRSRSNLTPREMQARLRAGRSIEEVALEASVDREWVERFAVPIMAEQAQVVELARSLTYSKPRLGESSQPLAESVAWNLSDRSVWLSEDVLDRSWTAYQLHDSVWMIRFRYRVRGREQEAHWELDVPAARLLHRNRLASELGYVEKGRRRGERRNGPEDVGDDTPVSVPRPTGNAVAAQKAVQARRSGGTAKAGGARKATAVAKPEALKKSPAVGKAPASKKAPAVRKAPASKKAPAVRKAPAASSAAPRAPAAGRATATREVDLAGRAGEVPRGRPPRGVVPTSRQTTSRPTTGAPSAQKAEPPRRIGTTFSPPGRAQGSVASSGRGRSSAEAGRAGREARAPATAGVRAATSRLATARVAASRSSAGRPGTPASNYPPSRARTSGLRSVPDSMFVSSRSASGSPRREGDPVASASQTTSGSQTDSAAPTSSARPGAPAAQDRSASREAAIALPAAPPTSAHPNAAESLDWDLDVDLELTDAGQPAPVTLPPRPFTPRPLPTSSTGAGRGSPSAARPSALRTRNTRTISEDLAGDTPVMRVDSSIPPPTSGDTDASGRRRRGLRRP